LGYQPIEDKKVRADFVWDAMNELIRMRRQLQGVARSEPLKGRTKDMPRRFFIERLAECFALSTGIVPAFSMSDKGTGSEKYAQSQWIRFLGVVFELVGLPTSLGSLDHFLREIGNKKAIKDLAGPPDRKSLSLGDFRSEGIALDYRPRPAPF
jgi:hypothetical protein